MKKKSIEDYLRIIYLVYEEQKDKSVGIRSVDVSRKLNVSKPTVSEMMKKLAKLGYVKVSPYSNIFLTAKGMNKAKKLSYNFKIVEIFLTRLLGYKDPEKIDEEAHMLEHAFSSESILRLDTFLSELEEQSKDKEYK